MRLASVLTVLALIVVACGGGPSSTGAPPGGSPSTEPAPSASPEVQRIEVSLSDQMLIEPARMTVHRGAPVTFVVTNTGQIEHEFYLGDEAAQAEHEEEMAAGEPMHGHSNAVAVAPGATEELSFTFTPGEWLAGCHVPGHYPAGMKATIFVVE
jgi:uncharacterized cupredoxin-like copper-binding protein